MVLLQSTPLFFFVKKTGDRQLNFFPAHVALAVGSDNGLMVPDATPPLPALCFLGPQAFAARLRYIEPNSFNLLNLFKFLGKFYQFARVF